MTKGEEYTYENRMQIYIHQCHTDPVNYNLSYSEPSSKLAMQLWQYTDLTDCLDIKINTLRRFKTTETPAKLKTVQKTTFTAYPEFNRPVFHNIYGAEKQILANRIMAQLPLRGGHLTMIERMHLFEQAYYHGGS